MKKIPYYMASFLFAISAGGALLSLALPQTVSAECNSGFLGFPAWYRGLEKSPTDCNLKSPVDLDDPKGTGLSKYIWIIGLNILEIALVAVGYLSGFYFLYGGFLFIVSRGNPEGAARARTTMLEALIGLIISLGAFAIVNFIVKALLG